MKRERFFREPGEVVIRFEDHEAAVVALHVGYADFPNGLRVSFNKAMTTRQGNHLITRDRVTEMWILD